MLLRTHEELWLTALNRFLHYTVQTRLCKMNPVSSQDFMIHVCGCTCLEGGGWDYLPQEFLKS